MDRSATWKGNRFWNNHDREGHAERLQVLTHKTIFPPGPGAEVIATGRSGDIIPVPDLLDKELSSIRSQAHGLTPSDIKVDSCPPLKLDIEALHSVSRGRSSSTSMSPIDMRIAELEASIVTERASRLSASQRILSNLRPELGCRISSLTNKSGISRLPLEITRKVVGFIEFRQDIAALACVSKSWREETLQALYSTIVLRGWDQIMSCLATVSSSSSIANRVTDLTLDTGSWPAVLNHQFYSIVTDALDKTRNLRRLVLILDSDITLGYDISMVLEHCRFRLHHFVYEGPDALQCLETFLDFQTMIRTLQVPHRATPGRFLLSLPPYTTQLWLPFLVHTHGCRYGNLENLSHLSLKGEIAHLALEQFRRSPIHYLAHDIAPWIASRMMLPEWFPTVIPDVFSNLRILRLIGYWVTCATDDAIASPHQSTATNPPPEPSQWADIDAFNLSAATHPFTVATPENSPLGIGSYLNAGQGEVDKSKAPTLRIEPSFLDMLRHLPHLQALEVGGFVVRDTGRLRTQTGNAEYWLSQQRTQWEEDFINCVTSRAAKNLVVISFLACDKSLYLSAFPNAPSSAADTHRLWSGYLDKARSKEALDAEISETTIFKLMAQTSLQRWSGSACEPSSRCDYNVDSAFVPSKLARELAEEVVMNEWINKGGISGWEKRVNVRHLRDIWPVGY